MTITHEMLKSMILGILEDSPDELRFRSDGGAIHRDPLIAVQDGRHEFFSTLGQIVPGHFHPLDAFPGFDGAVSVIAVSLPLDKEIVAENARQTNSLPATGWLAAKYRQSRLMKQMSARLADKLSENGMSAFSCDDVSVFQSQAAQSQGRRMWSHRHVSFGCGLGTFGLNGALITSAGVAHRLTTLVVSADSDCYGDVPIDPFRDCLYMRNGSCGACLRKCPVGAISASGHDPSICATQCQGLVTEHFNNLDVDGVDPHGCALCMCGVPCSMTCPVDTS